MVCYTLCTILHKFHPINTHLSFIISHFIISHSLLLFSSTMCFHHWPFTHKCYSSVLVVVWMEKRHRATMQICTIYMGVRLSYLGVKLIIKVSFPYKGNKHYPSLILPPFFFSFPSIFLHHRFSTRYLIILCNKLQS